QPPAMGVAPSTVDACHALARSALYALAHATCGTARRDSPGVGTRHLRWHRMDRGGAIPYERRPTSWVTGVAVAIGVSGTEPSHLCDDWWEAGRVVLQSGCSQSRCRSPRP